MIFLYFGGLYFECIMIVTERVELLQVGSLKGGGGGVHWSRRAITIAKPRLTPGPE